MIEGLIAGKLHQLAEERTGRTGRRFVTATVRAAAGEGEGVFVRVVAFSESAGAALQALDVGDGLALAGTLKPTAWTDRDGNARPGLDMNAAQVLTAYGLKKKRAALAPAGDPEAPPPTPAPAVDFGHGDDWLSGGPDQ